MLREVVSLEPRKTVVKEYTEKELGDGQVLIKNHYASCKHGTEMHAFRQDSPFMEWDNDAANGFFTKKVNTGSEPYIYHPGNMVVGEIVRMGKDVRGFDVGQRVAGYGHFRTTAISDADRLLRMDDRMTWQEAMCFDPAQFALDGIRDANIRLGDTAAVFGLGAIGQMTVRLLKQAGAACVFAVDPIAKRRAAALKGGADMAIDPRAEDAGLRIRLETLKKGADAAIETSGYYDALHAAIRAVGYNCNIAVVGWYKECTGGLNFGMEAHFNRPSLIFSRACSQPLREHPMWDWDRNKRACWEMLSAGMLDCEAVLDPVVSLEQAAIEYMNIDTKPEVSVKLGVDFSL